MGSAGLTNADGLGTVDLHPQGLETGSSPSDNN